jgi:hypothetical protein
MSKNNKKTICRDLEEEQTDSANKKIKQEVP